MLKATLSGLVMVVFLSGCATTRNVHTPEQPIELPCMADDSRYFKLGGAWRVRETKIEWYNVADGTPESPNPITARIQLGCILGNWRLGIDHDSNYFDGKPWNNNPEYSKYELFLDYEWRW